MESTNNLLTLMGHWETIAELVGQEKIQRMSMKLYFCMHVDAVKGLNTINDPINGYSVIHEVARKGYYNALIVLQKFGGDLDLQSPMTGLTPRNLLDLKHPQKARKLIERDARKEAKKRKIEEQKRQRERVQNLIFATMANNLLTLMGHWETIAELNGQEKIQRESMKLYFHMNVDAVKGLNTINDPINGYSVMHEVARKGYYNALIVLQKFGGDLDLQSPMNGLTPRNLLDLKHPQKARKLIERDARKEAKKRKIEEQKRQRERVQNQFRNFMLATMAADLSKIFDE